MECRRLALVLLLLVGVLATAFMVGSVRGQTLVNLQKTITSSTNDGYLLALSSSYAVAYASTSGAVYSSLDYVGVGQNFTGVIYVLYRSFLFFDMNDLPSDAVITNASVGVKVSFAPIS